MHEYITAKNLSEVIKKEAKSNNLKNITKVTIKIGEASLVDKDHLKSDLLQFFLPNTVIEFVEEKVKLKCEDCNNEDFSYPTSKLFHCPLCGGSNISIISGKNVYVEKVEGI